MSEQTKTPPGVKSRNGELINATATLPEATGPSSESRNFSTPLRSIKSRPFCWQQKDALDAIRQHFDGRRDGHTALAAYLALAETASDQQSERFKAEQSYLAYKAGMSTRTLGPLIPKLEAAGVLRTQKTALKAPLIYELIAVSPVAHSLPIDTKELTNDQQPLPNAQQVTYSPTLPTNKESKEESTEEDKENSAGRDFIESIYAAYPKKVGKPAALKAISKALQEMDATTLLEKTKAYAAAQAGISPDDWRFIPNPSTWFNQARYNDDAATWTKTKPARVIEYSESW